MMLLLEQMYSGSPSCLLYIFNVKNMGHQLHHAAGRVVRYILWNLLIGFNQLTK